MDIALVISSLNHGGAERIISELANYWLKSGHQVCIIILSNHDTKPFYKIDARIKIKYLNQIVNTKNYFMRAFCYIKRVYILRKSVKEYNPNIIISFINIINITTLIATLNLKKTIIISERTDPKCHKISLFCKFLRLILYPKAKFLVVQTQNAADYFPKYFNKFIRIIPNSVEKSTCTKENINSQVKNLVSVGRLDEAKDHKTLILAFSKLYFFHKMDLYLTIYGEGQNRIFLENLIRKLDLRHRIFLPGVTPDIYEKLSQADIFIFPSLYEGFPNALCEAMATGLPVIASKCTGNTTIIRDEIDGLLFPMKDVEVLVDKIIILINNEEKRQFFAKNALTIVDRFNSQSIYSTWDHLINLATLKTK